MTVKMLLDNTTSSEIVEWGIFHQILESERKAGPGHPGGAAEVHTMAGSSRVTPD